MTRYLVTIRDNRVVEIEALDDEDEEMLGLEWALSELKDSWRHSRSVDGGYTLAGKEELAEFLHQLRNLAGKEASEGFDDAGR